MEKIAETIFLSKLLMGLLISFLKEEIMDAQGSSNRKKNMQAIGDVLKNFDWDKRKYISQEFQDYGYRLAQQLSDLKHKALYIKMAKETSRNLLDEALRFVKEAYNVKSKARLFMWKLKELKKSPGTEEKVV
ncbi:hypothetical protein ACFLZP_02990 [Patescibacteria group bacterium]